MKVIRVERLTAHDLLMIYADGTWPQDVDLVAVMDGVPLLVDIPPLGKSIRR